MKKVIVILLCVLTILTVCLGCDKEPKIDPHEVWYGTYVMLEDETEVYDKSGRKLNSDWWPISVDAYIADIKMQAGKTIEITKEKIKFSGGSVEIEVDYEFHYDSIAFDRNTAEMLGFDFFLGYVDIADFKFDDGIIYQLKTQDSIYTPDTINDMPRKPTYTIYFYYHLKKI